MKPMKREHLEKCVIDLLIIGGVLLLALPFFKESIVSLQLHQSQLIIANQLPTTIAEEETITMPTFKDVVMGDSKSIMTYGFVTIDAIEFQQPLLVGVTNQNMLKGGVVMFPHRSLAQNNFVIVGHHLGRQSLLFGLLNEAQIGMDVTLNYLEQTQAYTITEKKIVEETDVDVLAEQSTAQLTLITCPIPSRTTERLVIVAKSPLNSGESAISKSEQYKVVNDLDQSSSEVLIRK